MENDSTKRTHFWECQTCPVRLRPANVLDYNSKSTGPIDLKFFCVGSGRPKLCFNK